MNGRPSRTRNLVGERRLAGAHEADRARRACQRAVQSIRSTYARHAATKSPSASPPNFSRAARASSHATARLRDDGERLDRRDVAALDERVRGLARLQIDRGERLHQRRQRLHRGAHDDLLAVRHAALDAAGAVRSAVDAALVARDLVVRLRAADAARARSRRRSRRPSPPGCPSAPPRAARRGGRPCARTSRGPAARRCARTSTVPPSVSRSLRAASTAAGSAPASGSAAPATVMPISREQRLRDGAGRDVHRGVPRRGALERVADVGEPVLLHAREIGVAGTRQRHLLRPLALRLALGRPRAHPPRPVLVVAVADDERERRPERAAAAAARRAPRPRRSRSAGAASGRSPAAAAAGRRRSPPCRASRPAGRPDTIATSAGPCDSPADASSSVTPASLVRRASTVTGAGTPVQRSNVAAPCSNERFAPVDAPHNRRARGRDERRRRRRVRRARRPSAPAAARRAPRRAPASR